MGHRLYGKAEYSDSAEMDNPSKCPGLCTGRINHCTTYSVFAKSTAVVPKFPQEGTESLPPVLFSGASALFLIRL